MKGMKVSALPTILFFGAIIFGSSSMQLGLCNAQCLDSEALLNVSYDPRPSREHEHHDQVVEIHVADSSPRMGSTMIEDVEVEYPSNVTFSFGSCIPRDDTCGHISVEGPPLTGLYEISWDGQVLGETSPELRYDDTGSRYFVTMQFGDGCVTGCDSVNDALFEYQYRVFGQHPDVRRISQRSYFVEDQNGTEIISGYDNYSPDAPGIRAGLHINRMCLPKNGCYRLVLGGRRRHDAEHVTISFGNRTVFEDAPSLYEVIEFGDNCPRVISCHPDKESKVQFFMRTKLDPLHPALSWELTSHNDTSSGSRTIHRGEQPSDYNITLHYDEICVPKQCCSTFSIRDLQNENMTSPPDADYMVKMDDIIYRSTSYSDQYNTFHLGDCAESSICNPVNETLLELNFQTLSKPNSSSLFALPLSSDTYWTVFKTGEVKVEDVDLVSGRQKGPYSAGDLLTDEYEYNSAYRVIKCIPSIKCHYSLLVQNSNDTSPFESYSIKTNGTLLASEPTFVDPDLYGVNYEVTALDRDCASSSGSLSVGEIVGIVFAGVLLADVLVATWVLVQRKEWVFEMLRKI